MLIERCDHNRFASQLAERIASPINALVVPTSHGAVTVTHNQPPSRLDYAAEAMAELTAWLKSTPVIQNHDVAQAGAALKERTKVAIDEARGEREEHTRPLRDRLNAIFERYGLVKDKGPLETAYNVLRKRLTDYASAVEAARIAEANRLRAEAEERERIARQAEAAELEAIDDAEQGVESDVGAAIEQADAAFTDFKRADKQAAIAERAVPVRFSSVLGGKRQAMRTVEVLAIENAELAIRAMGLTDKIRDAILSSARDYRREHEELPAGINATFERSL